MNKTILSLSILLMMSSMPYANAAEEFRLESIDQINELSRRAENLAFGALGGDNYHLAKARAWLDLATSEYHEKDTSGALDAAITEAANLLDALEKNQSDLDYSTPSRFPGSEAIRGDLLDKIAVLKNHEHFDCAQRPLANAEVYLVWAGHEFAESGQSHAESYIRSVENLVNDAESAIEACAEASGPDSSKQENITLSGDALFAFGKTTLNADFLWRLDKLAAHIKENSQIDKVVLVGHTDRLRSDGRPERNQKLSEKRAESLKAYLVEKGIPAKMISASGSGSSQPVVQCPADTSKQEQIDCLQPNRRVEIKLIKKKPKVENPASHMPAASETLQPAPVPGQP